MKTTSRRGVQMPDARSGVKPKHSLARTSWTSMLTEENVRARILRENEGVVKLLDFLVTRKKPFVNGQGWTVFNDWLDNAYITQMKYRPSDVPVITLDRIRVTVFPACRGNTPPM